MDWKPLTTIHKEPGSDGQDAEIHVCRMPAAFYRIKVLAGTNSIGAPLPAFTLQTGSGTEMCDLAFEIANAVAKGMLALGDPE